MALGSMEIMNRKVPANSSDFFRLASEYLRRGELDEAIRFCKEGLRDDPYCISGHLVLGKCYLAASCFKEARREFKRVLRLDPNNTAAFCYLAEINQALGQTMLALSNLKRALRLDPLAPGLKDKIDFLREELGFSRGTLAIKSAPEEDITSEYSELATPTLAEIYATQGRIEKAINIYRQVLDQNPEDQTSKQRLAQLEAQLAAREQADEEQD
ncbi:MAG: hypothetical protein DRQ02_09155 [Candidatus Latescibacterota bacterium]|nr:MAG: hypothetical protein DRQ02_09155 [Candidatus Latescibacterota bacterium]